MQNNLKFHAIAIGSICLIVIVLFFIMQPETRAPVETSPYATGDRYVRIDSASWGMNCNQEISRRMRQPRDAEATDKPLQLVSTNNVLLQMGELCNGRMVCQLSANSDILQEEPLSSCFKQLEVTYRCFSIDKLWRVQANQGDELIIDCKPEADAERTHG